MAKTGSGNTSGRMWTTLRVKHLTALALISLIAGLGLTQASSSVAGSSFAAGSIAALLDDQDEGATSRKITRNDCGYLQNPDGFRQAVAQHREEVSSATATF